MDSQNGSGNYENKLIYPLVLTVRLQSGFLENPQPFIRYILKRLNEIIYLASCHTIPIPPQFIRKVQHKE